MGAACTVAGSCHEAETHDAVAKQSSSLDNSQSGSLDSGSERANSSTTARSVEWMVVPTGPEARKKYVADGTLEPDCEESYLDLRAMLDEVHSTQALAIYSKKMKLSSIFGCWIDCQSCKKTVQKRPRKLKALEILDTYIVQDGPCYLDFITSAERLDLEEHFEPYKTLQEIVPFDFFDSVQKKCFVRIHDDIYRPFQQTAEFQKLSNRLHRKYNVVSPHDFEYISKIGEGGYGFVIHCKKISTGVHYAMKLQRKRYLLSSFRDDPWKVSLEKRALASCQHPFIVQLQYAFQTDALAVMVMDLSTAGDLQNAISESGGNKVDEERVRFYMAEIAVAISYLHCRGFMYRDLKPNNVLLKEDGHIQLVDLGGTVDVEHDEFSHHENSVRLIPLYKIGKSNDADESSVISQKHNSKGSRKAHSSSAATDTTSVGDDDDDDGADGHKERSLTERSVAFEALVNETLEEVDEDRPLKRKFSIMGTLLYMAPEMVVQLHQVRSDRKGYCEVVDWWSFGVTMYKMLTGGRPHTNENPLPFVPIHDPDLQQLFDHYNDVIEYRRLFQEVYYPSFVSDDAKDCMKKFLDVHEKKRLGYGGPKAIEKIQAHPFFASIDFELLEQKRLQPPYVPGLKEDYACAVTPTFELPPPGRKASSAGKVPKPKKKEVEPTSVTSRNAGPMNFDTFLINEGKTEWLDNPPIEQDQTYFCEWDYTSPIAMRVEAGLSQVKQQYKSNPKVRQFIGHVDKHSLKTEGSEKVKAAKKESMSAKAKKDGIPYSEAVQKLKNDMILRQQGNKTYT